MKKILKIILILVVLFIIYLLTLIYINNKNDKYLIELSNKIKENYEISSDITYINFHNNYYVLTTKEEIIVLNKEYDEILINDINILATNPNNYQLIYKNNKLMYESTTLKKNKINYKYYDATNNELIKETNMEKK